MQAGLQTKSAEELLQCKNRLALLNGQVEKLQFVKIDAVTTGGLNTGKQVAKSSRKTLNQRAERLHEIVRGLHKSIDDKVKELQA